MSKIDFKVISIGTGSHHNVNRGEFNKRAVVRNGDNDLEIKFGLLLDAMEAMDGVERYYFEENVINVLKEKFTEFMTNPTKYQISDNKGGGNAMLFTITTSEEWGMTFHFAHDLGRIGVDEPRLNMIFCLGEELNKGDNHWFNFHEDNQEELQKQYDQLMQKSKEELATTALIAGIDLSPQLTDSREENNSD